MEYTPVGVISLLIASLISIPILNYYQGVERKYQHARQTFEHSMTVAASDHLQSKEKAYREEWRTERDLEAQREMASTSWWMMWATWIGSILLSLNLWQSVNATWAAQKSARHSEQAAGYARDALIETDRAWMKVTASLSGVGLEFDALGLSVDIVVTATNVGKSPAVNVCVLEPKLFANLIVATDAARSQFDTWEFEGETDVGQIKFPDENAYNEDRCRLLREDFHFAGNGFPDFPFSPVVLAAVLYLLPGDRRRRFTYILLEVTPTVGRQLSVLQQGYISSDNLMLKQRLISGGVR